MTDRDKTKESSEVIESAWHALLALSRETLQFRFDYSLDIIPEAGPKESLDYYLYSERLSWSAMRMDPTGVPRAWERLTGTVYRPSYIAWWGLVNLSHFLRHHDDPSRVAFLKQVNWLEANSVVRTDGSVVWPNNFDYLEAKTILKAPWISAYDQGLVISALVRGYRFTKRPRLLELLQGASRIFELDVHEGGVRKLLSRGALYIERPGYPIPGILDGFMSSLLGLYDLFVETGDLAVGNLFTDGIEGLKEMLPTWDYRKRWSWYGAREYLCPPAYHSLNRVLLQVLGRLSAEPLLAEYAEAWKTDHLSALGRAEIFLGFLITKNASRVRNRTWLQSNGKVRALATLVPINQQLPSHPLGRRNSSPSRLPPIPIRQIPHLRARKQREGATRPYRKLEPNPQLRRPALYLSHAWSANANSNQRGTNVGAQTAVHRGLSSAAFRAFLQRRSVSPLVLRFLNRSSGVSPNTLSWETGTWNSLAGILRDIPKFSNTSAATSLRRQP
jgi:hypothetical protein